MVARAWRRCDRASRRGEANSQLPGTDQIASKVMAMIKEDMPHFVNLEVKSDRTF